MTKEEMDALEAGDDEDRRCMGAVAWAMLTLTGVLSILVGYFLPEIGRWLGA